MLDSRELDGDAEQRELFLSNVLRELQHDEYRICCDMLCSRVLEKLFDACTPAMVQRFAVGILDVLPDLLTHRYGSHVLQAIEAKVLPALRGADDALPVDEAEEAPRTRRLTETFLLLCETMHGQLAQCLADAYAGHVLATAALTLAGAPRIITAGDMTPSQASRRRSRAARAPASRTARQRGRSTAATTSPQSPPSTYQTPSSACWASLPMRCLPRCVCVSAPRSLSCAGQSGGAVQPHRVVRGRPELHCRPQAGLHAHHAVAKPAHDRGSGMRRAVCGCVWP